MADVTDQFWTVVAARFAERGWTEQPLDTPSTLYRQWAMLRPNGLVATVTVVTAMFGRVPGQVNMRPGVSRAGVGELRAALTLPVLNGDLLREGPMVTQPVPVGAPEARLMVDQATIVAISAADDCDHVDDLLNRLGGKAREGNYAALESAFLLAGAIRDERAARAHLAALEAFPAGSPARFIRQARRWVDAGMPDVPPIPEPDRAAPSPGPRFRQVLLTSLRAADAKHEAELSLSRRVRRNRSLSTVELRQILTDDLNSRGIPQPPTNVALAVDRTLRAQTLVGLVRAQVDNAQHWLELGGRVRTALSEKRLPRTPLDAAAPERAAFTYRHDKDAYADVVLDPDAIPRLRALAADNEVRVRRTSYLTAWLDGSQVMVGTQRVGVLTPESAAAFTQTLTAAGALDEAPRAPAFFVDLPEPVLSLPLPVNRGPVKP